MADEELTGTEDQASADGDIESGLDQVVQAAQGVSEAAGKLAPEVGASEDESRTVEFIMEVPLAVTVEVGRSRMTIQDLLQLGQGSVVELEKLAGDPLDIFINGQRVARGEAVIINEKFGVRLTEIISPEDRLERLR